MATGSLIGGAIYQNYGGVFLFRFGLSQCGGLEWHNDKIPCKRAMLGPRVPLKLPLVSVVVPSFLTPPHPLSHTTTPSHGHNRHIHAADLILAEFNLVNIWLDNRGSFVILKGLQAFSHSLWPHSTSLPITGSQDQRRTGSRKLLQRMRKNQPCCIILTCELSYCPASPGPPDGICRTQNWYCSFELLLF